MIMKNERPAAGTAGRSELRSRRSDCSPETNSPRPEKQLTKSRTGGPRLAVQSWHSVAAVLAREPQPVETAIASAMRRAFEREAGR